LTILFSHLLNKLFKKFRNKKVVNELTNAKFGVELIETLFSFPKKIVIGKTIPIAFKSRRKF
jgi:hypothetical protein